MTFFSSLVRLTLSNLYAFLKCKTLTFELSLSTLSWVLLFPLSLYPQTFPLQAIPIRSFAQFKALSQLTLLSLCVPHSYFIGLGFFHYENREISIQIHWFRHFQVIYMISHRIWNFWLIWIQFLLFFIKKYRDCIRWLN